MGFHLGVEGFSGRGGARKGGGRGGCWRLVGEGVEKVDN